jgi:hypothetical protein
MEACTCESCESWCKASPIKIESLVKTKFGSKVNYIMRNLEISWCHLVLLWERRNTKGTRMCTKCTHMGYVQSDYWNYVSHCYFMMPLMQHILCFSVQNKIETFDVCSITFAKRDFESELQVLHLCMMVDVLIVL